jgi:hypothetical protein
MPPVLTTTGNVMSVVFKTDYSASMEGFSATYTVLDSSTSEFSVLLFSQSFSKFYNIHDLLFTFQEERNLTEGHILSVCVS